MTIADHLRAVLAVTDPAAYRSPAHQAVIDAARHGLATSQAGAAFRIERLEAAAARDRAERAASKARAERIDCIKANLLTAAAWALYADAPVIAAEAMAESVTVVYGDSLADDGPRMRQRKAAAIIRLNREFESATSEAVRGMVAATPAGPRLALHQAIIAQDVASVPQERAKSECAPPPGVTQERAATGTVERSTACDIVARSLVKGRETQKLALSTYGREAQQDQAIEECAELIVALRHYQRGTGSLGELQGEIADVLVTVTTLAIQYGDEAIAACVDYKLDRLRKRLGGR